MTKRLSGVMAILVEGALRGYLTPKLAMDANIDLTPVVKDVTTANFSKLKPQLAERLKAACEGKLAQDADLQDVVEMLDALEDNKKEVAEAIQDDVDDSSDKPDDGTPDKGDDTPVPGGEEDKDGADDEDGDLDADDEEEDLEGGETETDPVARLTEFLKGKLSEEDMSRVQAIIDGDDPDESGSVESNPDDEDIGKDKDMVTKPAMDAAIQSAVRATEQAMIARHRSIREAEKAVFPFVGQVDGLAMDSAASVYKMALEANNVDLKGVPESAYPAMVKMLQRPGLRTVPGVSPTKIGMDAKEDETFKSLVGDLSHIKRR